MQANYIYIEIYDLICSTVLLYLIQPSCQRVKANIAVPIEEQVDITGTKQKSLKYVQLLITVTNAGPIIPIAANI